MQPWTRPSCSTWTIAGDTKQSPPDGQKRISDVDGKGMTRELLTLAVELETETKRILRKMCAGQELEPDEREFLDKMQNWMEARDRERWKELAR